MKNPERELKAYLKTLVHNLIYLNSILDQVNELNSWSENYGGDSIREGNWFYKVTLHSFKRILTLEACKLLLDREQRSLVDWLNKAHEHASSITATEYLPRQGFENDLRRLNKIEYRYLIDIQTASLKDHSNLINNLTKLRDFGFAHADKKYFDDPDKLETDFPITWGEFNVIYSLMSSIVKRHYSLLFNSDMNMHLTAHGTVNRGL